MHEFIVTAGAFKELQRAIINRTAMLMVMLIVVVFIQSYYLSNLENGISLSTWLTLVLLSGVMAYTLFSNLKRQKALLATYKLIISEDSITREMQNTPVITILKKDVKEIIKTTNGGFAIIAESKINAIGVSAHIERKEELEKLLTEIRPLTIKTSTSWLQKFQLPIAFSVVILMFIALYSTNKFLTAIAGVAFCVAMLYSFITIQRSKNVQSKIKRWSYVVFIPLISILYTLVMKLME